MIKHIVWWTFKPEAEDKTAAENMQIFMERLEAFRHTAGVKTFELSNTFLSSSTEEAQVLLQTTHENYDALREYLDDATHREFVEFARKVISSRRAIDYELI